MMNNARRTSVVARLAVHQAVIRGLRALGMPAECVWSLPPMESVTARLWLTVNGKYRVYVDSVLVDSKWEPRFELRRVVAGIDDIELDRLGDAIQYVVTTGVGYTPPIAVAVDVVSLLALDRVAMAIQGEG